MKATRTVAFGTALLLALSLSVSPAAAEILKFEGFGLYQNITVYAPGVAFYTGAGQLRLDYDDTDYLGYCVDLYQYLAYGQFTPQSVTGLRNGEQVAWLFEHHADSLQTGLEAAALQTAIWEVLVESDSNAYNVRSGLFHITGNDAAASLANLWLSEMPNTYTPTYDLAVLHSDEYQDVLIGGFNPVPEPATLGLLGIGGLVFLVRKRRRV